MSETTEDKATIQPQGADKKPFTPVNEDRSFHELLRSMVGQLFTIVNPESFEDAPLRGGHELRVGFYRGKLIGLGQDYLILATEYAHLGKSGNKEPVRQYLPISKIKRVSIMPADRLLHV